MRCRDGETTYSLIEVMRNNKIDRRYIVETATKDRLALTKEELDELKKMGKIK